MRTKKSMQISVYDNERSFDRYTVVLEVGLLVDFYGMSANAKHSQGFNQYLGSNHEGLKKGKHLGKNIGWDGAPYEVKLAIIDILKGY